VKTTLVYMQVTPITYFDVVRRKLKGKQSL